jgi:hypothetical protein
MHKQKTDSIDYYQVDQGEHRTGPFRRGIYEKIAFHLLGVIAFAGVHCYTNL